MPAVQGRVSLPSSTLTPGAVTTTDANTVCNIPAHAQAPGMPSPVQTAVLTAYGYTTAAAQHKYVLDYLVPYDLGGAATQANIWPAAIRGTGFYQKTQTDYILRQLVCLALDLAGHGAEDAGDELVRRLAQVRRGRRPRLASPARAPRHSPRRLPDWALGAFFRHPWGMHKTSGQRDPAAAFPLPGWPR